MKFDFKVDDMGLEADLFQFPKRAGTAVRYAGRKAGREGIKTLKATSPKLYGDYSKGWSLRDKSGMSSNFEWVMHNRTHWGLVHLLEDGHYLVFFGKYTGEWVNPKPHFKSATKEAGDNFVEYCNIALDGIE